jgi:hypothetical protein
MKSLRTIIINGKATNVGEVLNGADVNPVGVNPVGVNPIDVNPIGVNPVGVNPIDVNPVGVNPIDVNPIDVKIGRCPILIEYALSGLLRLKLDFSMIKALKGRSRLGWGNALLMERGNALLTGLLLIGLQLIVVCSLLTPQTANAQACGSCATPDCIGIKQYANKSAVLTGLNKVWKTYSPTLTSATGAFTVYVTVTTDAWGQVGVMQEFSISGPTTGITPQLQAVAGSRTSVLYAMSDATCTNAIYPANINNDGCSTTYNPAWTNLSPNTSYKLALTTNLSGLASGYTYSGFNIRFYNAVRPIASFNFNCGTATYLGSFTANGTAGQNGSLTIPITSATAGSATLNVSGTGFTGSVTTNIAAGQTSVAIPITYNGTGAAGSRTLTITSSQGMGTCTTPVTVDPQLATFNFNCATASATGNHDTPQ